MWPKNTIFFLLIGFSIELTSGMTCVCVEYCNTSLSTYKRQGGLMQLECNRQAVNNKDNSSIRSGKNVSPDTNHTCTCARAMQEARSMMDDATKRETVSNRQ